MLASFRLGSGRLQRLGGRLDLDPLLKLCRDSVDHLLWHDLYLREYLSAYRNARLFGAPTLVRRNRSLPFAEALGDLAPRTAVERILDWDFDQIIVGHGAVVENNGKEVFRTAFRWLLKRLALI